MIEITEIEKIIFNPSTKKYNIRFRSMESMKTFNYLVSSDMAKKISMSVEGISSNLLSPYKLFIELLDLLKIRLDKVVVIKNKRSIDAKISLKFKNGHSHFMFLNICDAVIIGLKTYSNIYIDNKLFSDREEYGDDDVLTKDETLENINLFKDKISTLEKAMEDSIQSEKYETAAFIRDRIKELKDR